jgi:L-alanine-DL-glutamate epimerase-like enolase superfamily enzyme
MTSDGVRELDQPLPAGQDAALANLSAPLPIFADESCHVAADIPLLAGLYQGVNIKLDKAGGLTEALALCKAAESARMDVMVGLYAVDQSCPSGGVPGGAEGILG